MAVTGSRLVLAAVLFATAACGGAERPEVVSPATVSPSAAPTLTALPRAYDPKADADADIADAFTRAKADGRPVLLDFGARWCPDCMTIQQYFRLHDIRPLLDRYHLVTIDVGQFDRHMGLARKYGLNLVRDGIPALVVLSPKGEVRTAGNKSLYPHAAHDVLLPENVAAFLRRWQ